MSFSQDWSEKLVGEYRLLRQLGGGSFGNVYLAKDVRTLHLVAVKLIKAPLTQREDLKAFLNEARSMRLHHPHIVPLFDFGLSEQDLPFLVMEYVAGGTLRDRYPKGRRVPLDMIVGMTTQIASALQYAHDQHLVHRDVKPENMLSRPDGTVLLSDFGIASVVHASGSASAYHSIGGTLPYMAPEQQAGKPRPASDQYALAVVVYEWLTGTRPFQGTIPEILSQHLHAPPPSLRDQIPTLPTEVEQVVFKALSKQPEGRFARVDDFALALQAASRRHALPSPELPALLEWNQPAPGQAIKPDLRRGGETYSAASPAPLVSQTRTDQPTPEKVSPVILPEAAMILSKKVSDSTVSDSQTSILTQHRRTLSRRVLFTLALVFLLILSGSGLWYFITSGETTKQGIMFGFDAAHTHNNHDERTLSPANVSQLSLLWSFTAKHYVASSPAVSGGIIYIGSHDHNLYAFDASCRKDCQPLWSFATGNEIISSPAVADGVVYIGSGDNKLYAFDASCRKDCQPLWSFATGSGIISSPDVAGGVIYIGSMDNKLYAFDANCRKDCLPLWSFATGGQIRSSPAVANGIVYIGSDDSKLYAFDASCRKDCQPLWGFATGGLIWSSPTVANEVVYVGSGDNKLYAFDASCRKDCQPLWSFATGNGIASSPHDITSSPAAAGGIIYIGSLDSKLYAFDASCRKDCQPLWSFATGGGIASSPTVAGGVVYIGSLDSKLYAFDASCRKDCQPLWRIDTGGLIWSSPTIADGVIYIGSLVGKFYAFGLAA